MSGPLGAVEGVDVRPSKESDAGFRLDGYVNGYPAGWMTVERGSDVHRKLSGTMVVTNIFVEPYYRRSKLGTAMYEFAAQHACGKYGKPLASDRRRSGFSDAFWEKQEEKGRASRIDLTTPGLAPDEDRVDPYTLPMDEHYDYDYAYSLTCPPPSSLRGIRKLR